MIPTTSRLLPKKITELGRIRIGDQEANSSGKGTHPHKLATFRLTSPNKPLLHFAAQLYGGEVRPWTGERAPDDQYELYTTVNAMDVLVPTASAISVQYEQWSAGGCTRRCTGDLITHCPLNEALVQTACQCPEDDKERAEAAQDGKACARVCRLNVLLPDLPGMGTWRLDTKGHYATAELLGSLEMLQMAQHQIIEATLRLDQRTVKRWLTDKNGKRREQSTTLKFVVPVLWPKYTPRQMLAAADRRVLLMEPLAQSQLPQHASAANAADDLYGDGAGDRMRNGHRQLSPPPPDDEVTEDAGPFDDIPEKLHGGKLWLDQIEAVWRAGGLDAEQIAGYWVKTCKRFHVDTREQLKASVLPQLKKEAQAWTQKNTAPQEPTLDPEPVSTRGSAWRSELSPACNGVQDKETLDAVWDAINDPDTPDTVGEALLERVRVVAAAATEEGDV